MLTQQAQDQAQATFSKILLEAKKLAGVRKNSSAATLSKSEKITLDLLCDAIYQQQLHRRLLRDNNRQAGRVRNIPKS